MRLNWKGNRFVKWEKVIFDLSNWVGLSNKGRRNDRRSKGSRRDGARIIYGIRLKRSNRLITSYSIRLFDYSNSLYSSSTPSIRNSLSTHSKLTESVQATSSERENERKKEKNEDSNDLDERAGGRADVHICMCVYVCLLLGTKKKQNGRRLLFSETSEKRQYGQSVMPGSKHRPRFCFCVSAMSNATSGSLFEEN